jgi:hypothetical protein
VRAAPVPKWQRHRPIDRLADPSSIGRLSMTDQQPVASALDTRAANRLLRSGLPPIQENRATAVPPASRQLCAPQTASAPHRESQRCARRARRSHAGQSLDPGHKPLDHPRVAKALPVLPRRRRVHDKRPPSPSSRSRTTGSATPAPSAMAAAVSTQRCAGLDDRIRGAEQRFVSSSSDSSGPVRLRQVQRARG